MSEHKIDPAKVTKPLQLLAAWLVGLVIIDGSFLSAAAYISKPEWASGALVAAAILNVPLFLFCLFLLQTKFRPEMQEDQYYSSYLEKRYSVETAQTEFFEVKKRITLASSEGAPINVSATSRLQLDANVETRVRINDLLPLYAELRDVLEKEQVHIYATFGTTSVSKKAPSIFVATIGEAADMRTFARVVAISRNYGLKAISYGPEPVAQKEIYIGAYGYSLNPILPIGSKSFQALTLDSMSWQELKQTLTTSPDLISGPVE